MSTWPPPPPARGPARGRWACRAAAECTTAAPRARLDADAYADAATTSAGLGRAARLVGSGRAIGAGDITGRVAPGLRADLLVLDRDPLVDPAALARPRWVIAGGRPVAW